MKRQSCHCALCHEDIWRSEGIAPPSLTSTLDGSECSASRLCRFSPGERISDTHWIWGWVDPRAGLDAIMKIKILLLLEIEPVRPARSPLLYRLSHLYSGWLRVGRPRSRRPSSCRVKNCLCSKSPRLCLPPAFMLYLAWFTRPWRWGRCSFEKSVDFQRTTRRLSQKRVLLRIFVYVCFRPKFVIGGYPFFVITLSLILSFIVFCLSMHNRMVLPWSQQYYQTNIFS
jgi:hypothetical protein